MYETLKVLIYSGMVELPNNEILLNELRQLNLIKGIKVDHTKNSSKDIADAVVRVVWSCYLDSIRDAIHGNVMLPTAQKFPTVRSVAAAYEVMKEDMYSEYPHYGIFGKSSGKGVFGKSTYIEPNITPNVGGTKF